MVWVLVDVKGDLKGAIASFKYAICSTWSCSAQLSKSGDTKGGIASYKRAVIRDPVLAVAHLYSRTLRHCSSYGHMLARTAVFQVKTCLLWGGVLKPHSV